MLSNACQYAIRSILYLAIHTDENEKMGVKKIAEELETPQPFLAKLLQQLSRNNLVSSTKGPKGGFYLNKKDKENSIWDVIICIDGTSKFDQCFLGLTKCNEEAPCPVHFTVVPFKKKLLQDFRDKTIAKFAKDIQENGNLTVKNLKII